MWELAKTEADKRGCPAPWLIARVLREGLANLGPGLTLTQPEWPPPWDPDLTARGGRGGRPDPPPYRPRREWITGIEAGQRDPDTDG